MKFAVCADLQFDLYKRLSTPHPNGGTSRLADALACWDWIVDTAVKRGCEHLLVLGDIFESRTTLDLPVLDLVCRAFERASKKIGLTILAGNHDSYLRHAGINSIQAFKGYATVIDTPACAEYAIGVWFGFVPWTEDLTAFRESVDTVSKEGAKFLFSHVLLEGATGGGKGVPLEYLQAEKFDYVVLGDVHDSQAMAENVFYVGSPMQIDWRDAGQHRGFYVFSGNGFDYVENTISPRFFVVTNEAEARVAGEGDFVRIRVPDGKEDEAKKVVTLLERRKAAWVESGAVKVEETVPRLKVSASDAHADALTKYTRLMLPEDEDVIADLVSVGLDLLNEART